MDINDQYYLSMMDYILSNKEFLKLKNIEHHGTTRFDHSIRVSYVSYKITKALKLDYKATAKAGLLHDFFISDNDRTQMQKLKSTFVHPKYAIKQCRKYFDLTEKEENIIEAHMFPIYYKLPKYMEGWIVSGVDKVVGLYEFSLKFKYKFSYVTNLMIIVLLNSIK